MIEPFDQQCLWLTIIIAMNFKAFTPKPPLPIGRIQSQDTLLSASSPQKSIGHLVRTNSQAKSFKKSSLDKTKGDATFQQNLKYNKSKQKYSNSNNQQILVNSSSINNTNFLKALQDSYQTQPRKNVAFAGSRVRSRDERKKSISKCLPIQTFELHSPLNSSSNVQGSENYYVYWKGKAHQFLQNNIKLVDQIKQLRQENEALKSKISSLEHRFRSQIPIDVPVVIQKDLLQKQVRKETEYLITKINTILKQLKQKQTIVVSYQKKIEQFSKRIAGDQQRVKLMQKMQEQINNFKTQKNKNVKKSPLQTSIHSETARSSRNFLQPPDKMSLRTSCADSK